MRLLSLSSMVVLVAAILGSSEANADPPGFGVSLNNVTSAKSIVNADGTYTCPSDYKVVGGKVVLTPEKGQQGTETKLVPVVTQDANGKDTLNWTASGMVPPGKYSVEATLTFRKKNPMVGDMSFDVKSNVKTGVVVTNYTSPAPK